jgi:putative SOS response-associated peptidase YedK
MLGHRHAPAAALANVDDDDSQFYEWMRGAPDQAAVLMKPYAGAIEAWEVGAAVRNVKNNRPELMDRVGLL